MDAIYSVLAGGRSMNEPLLTVGQDSHVSSHIILISARAQNQARLCAALRAMGLQVQSLGLAAEPPIPQLPLWQQRSKRIILIDASEPNSHGQALALAAWVRLQHQHPVVVLLSEAQRHETKLVLSMGAQACFIEPIDLQDVMLALAHLARDVRAQNTQLEP